MKELILAEFIEKIAGGEKEIEKAIISSYDEQESRLSIYPIQPWPEKKSDVLLDWDEAKKFLNFKISYRHGTGQYNGYTPRINFTVWTSGKIIFPCYVGNGDKIVYISRNPMDNIGPIVPLTAGTYDGR